MKQKILYTCVSHIGNCRKSNQDNYICGGMYMDKEICPDKTFLQGCAEEEPALYGVFDGLGGEARGEVAARIAAEAAAKLKIGKNSIRQIENMCYDANDLICQYSEENEVGSMGTTAALIAIEEEKAVICNIGDSKIFRYSANELDQLSVDHVLDGINGRKPLLTQNLGIPEDEMIIEPYIAEFTYKKGDIFLMCSDGLTDMVSKPEMKEIFRQYEYPSLAEKLLDTALGNGGKDNVTIVLCKIA